ncbi:acid-sensing ion channel 1-like [Rhopilema esculentum]|uniref:acid-sensing ion channel 1-like n=1 Tax=Rhopilema esculentum TaxID=499914 RepID=UPI0031DB6F68|eukprot:gene11426-21628_t
MDQRTANELKESAANLTMHGFGRLLSTKSKAMRCIWLLLMLFFVSLVILTVTPTVRRYFKSPSLTKVETVRVSEMKMPAITVCGPSFSKAKVTNFAKEKNLTVKYNRIGLIDNIDDILGRASSLEDLAFDNNTMFIINPDENDIAIERVLVANQGYCYKVNANGSFVQRSTDIEKFLFIGLFLNISDGVYLRRSTTDSVEVNIQDHRQLPSRDSGTVLAPVGHLTSIEIKKTEIKRLKPPYPSKCTNGENLRLLFKGDYSISNCRLSCFLIQVSQKCSRIHFFDSILLPKAMRKPLARNESELSCTYSIHESLYNSNYASCNCELPCTETRYNKYSSSAKLTSSDPSIHKHIVAINVFFGGMEYEKITELKMYTTERFVGEIGGQMGIWIGASIFSLFELIYLFVQFAGVLCRKKRRKSSNLDKGMSKEANDSVL